MAMGLGRSGCNMHYYYEAGCIGCAMNSQSAIGQQAMYQQYASMVQSLGIANANVANSANSEPKLNRKLLLLG